MRRTALAMMAAALTCALLALPAAAKDVQVAVQDNEFVPKSIEIDVGDTVVWSHQGSRPHTVTADDGSWDSNPDCPANIASCMVAGQSYERQFNQAGSFPYYCKLHGSAGGGGMAGVVVVRAAQSTPPPPPPTTAPPATTSPPATRAPTTTAAETTSDEPTTTVAADEEPSDDHEPVLESDADSDEGDDATTSTTFELAAEVDGDGDGGAPVGLIAGGIVLLLAAGGLAGWRYWPRAG